MGMATWTPTWFRARTLSRVAARTMALPIRETACSATSFPKQAPSGSPTSRQRPNTLYRNDGGGMYTDASLISRLGAPVR